MLLLDVHEEETAVELFAKNIMIAGQVFLDSPMESPNIPTCCTYEAIYLLESFSSEIHPYRTFLQHSTF